MRVNSPKQTKASRENGSKSKGPKSEAAKSKSAQNAIRDGLFSRQIVVEQLGEKPADFKAAKNSFWQILQPANNVEEMLVMDFVENWWRRERVRGAETRELESRLAWLDLKNDLRRDDEVEALRSRFFVLFGLYLKAFNVASIEAVSEIIREFEEVREQLASTTLGIDFLLGLLKYLEDEAKSKGVLSDDNELLIKACCGFGSRDTDVCLKFNLISKRASQKWDTKDHEQPKSGCSDIPSGWDPETIRLAIRLQKSVDQHSKEEEAKTSDPEKFENSTPKHTTTRKQPEAKENESTPSKKDCCAMLASAINGAALRLHTRQIKFQLIEAAEVRRASSLATFDPSSSGRFSRAETAVERRMYRALAALATMRAQSAPLLLPEAGSKNQK